MIIDPGTPLGDLLDTLHAMPKAERWPALRAWLRAHRITAWQEPEAPPTGDWTEVSGAPGLPGYYLVNGLWYSEDALDLCRMADIHHCLPAGMRNAGEDMARALNRLNGHRTVKRVVHSMAMDFLNAAPILNPDDSPEERQRKVDEFMDYVTGRDVVQDVADALAAEGVE